MFLATFCVPAVGATLDAPIEVGAGPALYWLPGQRTSQEAATLQYGATLRLMRILSERTLVEHRDDGVPANVRARASALGELHLRVTPLDVLIPRHLAFSRSETYGHSMYGASWRLFTFAYVWIPPTGAGTAVLSVSPAFSVYDLTLDDYHTWFVRPGVAVGLDTSFPIGERLRLGFGVDGQFHVPQRIGGGVLEVGPLNEALWFVGEPWAMLSVRIPSTIRY
jgi:hypothetical protein